jgi:hypothetical protein
MFDLIHSVVVMNDMDKIFWQNKVQMDKFQEFRYDPSYKKL